MRECRRTAPYREWVEGLERREMLAVDLTGAFIGGPTAVAGAASVQVTVSIHNVGIRPSRGIWVDVYALRSGQAFDPASTPLTAPHVGSFTIAGNLAQFNGSNTSSLTVKLPPSMAAGNYQFFVPIDRGHAIKAEINASNNVFHTSTFAVQPDYDLVPSVAANTVVPTAIVGGTTVTGRSRSPITNMGTATIPVIPSSVPVYAAIVARPVGLLDSSKDVVLQPSSTTGVVAPVGKLGGGQSVSFTINVDYSKLAAGDYNILYLVDTLDVLAETSETNNMLKLSACCCM